MRKRCIHRPVRRAELKSLVTLARAEERAFFARNPHLVRPYGRRLLAIALCQGAALQYLEIGYGVNDFDVHFFYAQNPAKPRLSRRVNRIFAIVGDFKRVPIDFIRTVVGSVAKQRTPAEDKIKSYLRKKQTPNPRHLSQKAVVGLYPKALLGRVIWRPGNYLLP